jgi:hypothetical protein
MPNSVAKLVYAVRNFSGSTVERMNAEGREAEWGKADEMFEVVLDAHKRCLAQFQDLKLKQEELRCARGKLKQKILEELSSLSTNGALNQQAAESVEGARGAFERLGSSIVQASDRAVNLLGQTVDRMETRLDQFDNILQNITLKRDQVNELVHRGPLSSEDTDYLDALVSGVDNDLTDMIREFQDNGNDATSMKELEETVAAFGKIVLSMNSSSKA